MNAERANLLKLLFPSGIPVEWEYNSHFNEYITKVGSYKIEDLVKEPARVKEENNTILDQTQELAVTNYKTFIQTAECSRNLFVQFNKVEKKLDELLEDIPKFDVEFQSFANETNGINDLRRLNTLTLTRNAQLLEILELPQLMDSFIKDGLYEDALALAAYVRRLFEKQPDIPIFKNIVRDVEKTWLVMLHQLLNQLRQELSLPKCLQIVTHLRHMKIFTETELRLKFLQARNTWFQECLTNIPNYDSSFHLNKTIEITRVNLFNIVTQYRAIFNDDEHGPLVAVRTQNLNQNAIFFSWIKDKIFEFLTTLKTDLAKGVASIDTVLGQCMYFGFSFSRIGCDFRCSLIPIFTEQVSKNFQCSIQKATKNFENNIERYTLINRNFSGVPWKMKLEDHNQPPESLIEFYPLAEYLNNILTAFNELRVCAPIAVAANVVEELEHSLRTVAEVILVFYGQERQAFTSTSKDAFTRFCICFADDLVPYIQKCLHMIFPPNLVASHVGINVFALQKDGISFLDKSFVVEVIKHLLPVKIEPVLGVSDEGNLKTESGKEGDTNDDSVKKEPEKIMIN